MKAKKQIKARMMWTTAQQMEGDNDGCFRSWYNSMGGSATIPLRMLDFSDETQIEAQAANAVYRQCLKSDVSTPHQLARAVLSSLGLIRTRKTK